MKTRIIVLLLMMAAFRGLAADPPVEIKPAPSRSPNQEFSGQDTNRLQNDPPTLTNRFGNTDPALTNRFIIKSSGRASPRQSPLNSFTRDPIKPPAKPPGPPAIIPPMDLGKPLPPGNLSIITPTPTDPSAPAIDKTPPR